MIVCLGWGSLIWSPRNLAAAGAWHADGPLLPVEFSRIADDGRLTLAITPGAAPVPVLWIGMALDDLDAALANLAAREGCATEHIGYWSEARAFAAPEAGTIGAWARGKRLTGVVWTALPAGTPEARGTPLTLGEALDHLRGLRGEALARAEDYVRRAPRQTRTAYRTAIEDELG